MAARNSAVALSLALTVAMSVWLLAQFALSAAAGRDLAQIAGQGARLLPFSQLLLVSLFAPWLYLATRGARALSSTLIFVLTPLPLWTLLALTAGTPPGAAGIGLAGVLAWGLLTIGAAALLRRTGMSTLEPLGLALIQTGAIVIVWRAGGDWIRWIGVP